MDENKSAQKVRVDICVVTYRRTSGLIKLIHSLASQVLTGSKFLFRIVVVDNDSNESARDAILKLKESLGIDIIYCVEPTKGVASARNRAIEEVAAEYFAFLDDDEFVSRFWFENIWKTMVSHDADIVFGPVSGVFEKPPPKWCLSHPSFLRLNKKDGSLCTHGASGNVLIRKESILIDNELQKFDLKYSLTGGEDTEYFYRLNKNNIKMIWCQDAEVYEVIPPSRANLGWVVRRAYRGGQCYYRIFKKNSRAHSKLLWCVVKVLQVMMGGLLIPIFLLIGNGHFEKLICRMSGAVGQISCIFGEVFTYQEYK